MTVCDNSFQIGLAKNGVWTMFFPRRYIGEKEIWIARLEHSVLVYRQRPRMRHASVEDVLFVYKGNTLGRVTVHHR